MFVYLALLILAVTSLAMLVLRLARPYFVYHWLVAAAGATLAWPMALLAGREMPKTLYLVSWEPQALFPSWPILLVDRISWPFAAALAALALASVLTDVTRAAEADWPSWAGSLVLTALGLLAVLAGNPLTLLLTWTAIDLVELLILLGSVKESRAREQMVVSFTARIFGSGLLLAATLVEQAGGKTLTLASISPQASWILLLSAGLRMGVLPFHSPYLQASSRRRGLGSVARLVAAAAALALIARTAAAIEKAGAPEPAAFYLMALAGVASIYGGAAWLIAEDELDGRPAWLLGMASLAAASALRGQPSASLAWGLAALLSGGVLFLASVRDRRLSWLSFLGLVGFLALPFTPGGSAARLFAPPFRFLQLFFLLGYALFLWGYVRHVLRAGKRPGAVERWIWLIYPFGLALLPLTHFLVGFSSGIEDEPAGLAAAGAGLAALALAALGLAWSRRVALVPRAPAAVMESILSLRWSYAVVRVFFRAFERAIAFLTLVLEGEGGVLWALLLLVLSLVLLAWMGGP